MKSFLAILVALAVVAVAGSAMADSQGFGVWPTTPVAVGAIPNIAPAGTSFTGYGFTHPTKDADRVISDAEFAKDYDQSYILSKTGTGGAP